MARTPEQIQQAMRRAMQAGDQPAVAALKQMLTDAYTAEAPKATEGMSGLQKFTAGMGQGAVNLGRQAGNILGMDRFSDENLAERAREDEALLSTGAGRAGSVVGEVLATAPVGGAIGTLGKGALGAGRAARLATGAVGQGAAEGALTAGPGNRGSGAALGAAGGAIIPWAGGAALRKLTRGIEPTAAARRLMREGVELTPGQMNPASAIGQLEEAATNVWGVGPMIQGARETAQQDWRKAVRGAVLPPGANADLSNGSLESVYRAYEPAYDAAKGFPTQPRVMRTAGGDQPLASFPQVRGLFEQAVRDPNIRVDDAARKSMHKWLQNKLTQLPGRGRGAQPVDSADLLSLRSEIRAEIRNAGKGANPDAAAIAMLENAEKAITDTLESQLPKSATDMLRATDKQYGKYKVLEDATRRAGDQISGVSPSQLSAAVKAATPNQAYALASGTANKGGDPLRQLASSGKQVFDVRTPPTGARLATLAGPAALIATNPWLGIPLAGGAVLGATTKMGRKVMAGGTKAQQKAKALEIALRRKAGAGGRRAGQTIGTATGAALGGELNEE